MVHHPASHVPHGLISVIALQVQHKFTSDQLRVLHSSAARAIPSNIAIHVNVHRTSCG